MFEFISGFKVRTEKYILLEKENLYTLLERIRNKKLGNIFF
jgi:hypothetical protein